MYLYCACFFTFQATFQRHALNHSHIRLEAYCQYHRPQKHGSIVCDCTTTFLSFEYVPFFMFCYCSWWRCKRCNSEVSGKRNRFGEHLTWLRHLKCKCHIMPTFWHLLELPFWKFFFQRLYQIVTEALQQQTSETMREEASCFLLVISAFNFTLIFSLTS